MPFALPAGRGPVRPGCQVVPLSLLVSCWARYTQVRIGSPARTADTTPSPRLARLPVAGLGSMPPFSRIYLKLKKKKKSYSAFADQKSIVDYLFQREMSHLSCWIRGPGVCLRTVSEDWQPLASEGESRRNQPRKRCVASHARSPRGRVQVASRGGAEPWAWAGPSGPPGAAQNAVLCVSAEYRGERDGPERSLRRWFRA